MVLESPGFMGSREGLHRVGAWSLRFFHGGSRFRVCLGFRV